MLQLFSHHFPPTDRPKESAFVEQRPVHGRVLALKYGLPPEPRLDGAFDPPLGGPRLGREQGPSVTAPRRTTATVTGAYRFTHRSET
nr:hypothetical protein [Nonomuraea polychroma]